MTTLLFLTLITYRVSTDLAWMSGPFDLFGIWREWAIRRWANQHWIMDGITCPVCMAWWVAAVGAGVVCLFGYAPWHLYPAYWLASAGGAALLARVR